MAFSGRIDEWACHSSWVHVLSFLRLVIATRRGVVHHQMALVFFNISPLLGCTTPKLQVLSSHVPACPHPRVWCNIGSPSPYSCQLFGIRNMVRDTFCDSRTWLVYVIVGMSKRHVEEGTMAWIVLMSFPTTMACGLRDYGTCIPKWLEYVIWNLVSWSRLIAFPFFYLAHNGLFYSLSLFPIPFP